MMPRAPRFVRTPKDIAYYMYLDNPNTIRRLIYRFEYIPLIYGITNMVNQMIYIGSTMLPHKRFRKHLIIRSDDLSNTALQQAIDQYGLENFKVQIFEKVVFPSEATYNEKQALLREVEQRYIDHFPKAQLYNAINSKV